MPIVKTRFTVHLHSKAALDSTKRGYTLTPRNGFALPAKTGHSDLIIRVAELARADRRVKEIRVKGNNLHIVFRLNTEPAHMKAYLAAVIEHPDGTNGT